jgi:hypothetical protein
MPLVNEATQEVQGSREGVLRSFVTLGARLTDTTIGAALGSLEDLRTNGFGRVRGLIDWVEAIQKANIDLARRLTDRADTVTGAFIHSGEQALKTVVLATRETSHGALDTASRSAAAFISKPAERAPLS